MVDNNHVARYRCDDGLNLIGSDVIECLSNGSWTDLNLKCTDCPYPPNILNAALNTENIRHDDVNLTYMCIDGYHLVGAQTIFCQDDFTWSPTMFVCTACPYPSSIQNTTIEVEVIAGDRIVKYSCISELTQIGIGYTSCDTNTWTLPSFMCSNCSYPPYIQNTTIEVEIIAGDPVVKYSCITGLTQIGFEYTSCANNTWTLPTFICSGCGHPPSKPNATVLVEKELNDIIVNYRCDEGFNITGLSTLQCEMGTWIIGNFTCVSV
ncbi:protein lev-9-like [Mytilus edulis]|uniref:protein lev-9-like n=1 Tax=Mytilus edulis TaxID=6550 RepID=UPI0039F0F9C6